MIDSLLRMLVQHDGDLATLVIGKAPSLSSKGTPMRLFFPTFTTALRGQLLGELLTDERLLQLERGETVSFVYEAASIGAFDVQMQGEGCTEATFSRQGVERPEEEAAELILDDVSSPPVTAEPVARQAVTAEAKSALDELLRTAHRMTASDLHLADDEEPVVRVDGRLRPMHNATANARDAIDAVLAGPYAEELDRTGSVDRGFDLNHATRIRAHVYKAGAGRAAALRLLRRRPPAMESLHLPVPIEPLIAAPHGLILFAGPTGSGKSTTMAGLAQLALEGRRGLLVTLEDPIEYRFEASGDGSLVRQRQVGRDTPTFPDGLRDALREDPDLVLIGELRDAETISLALTAAETGHLVLASVHSRSTASAIDRIIDGMPSDKQSQARIQLANSLQAVVSQRLLPAANGDGRVVALEILRNTHAVAHLIRESKTAQLSTSLQAGGADGMLPLERCLRDLVRNGRIDRDIALAAATDPKELDRILRT